MSCSQEEQKPRSQGYLQFLHHSCYFGRDSHTHASHALHIHILARCLSWRLTVALSEVQCSALPASRSNAPARAVHAPRVPSVECAYNTAPTFYARCSGACDEQVPGLGAPNNSATAQALSRQAQRVGTNCCMEVAVECHHLERFHARDCEPMNTGSTAT